MKCNNVFCDSKIINKFDNCRFLWELPATVKDCEKRIKFNNFLSLLKAGNLQLKEMMKKIK